MPSDFRPGEERSSPPGLLSPPVRERAQSRPLVPAQHVLPACLPPGTTACPWPGRPATKGPSGVSHGFPAWVVVAFVVSPSPWTPTELWQCQQASRGSRVLLVPRTWPRAARLSARLWVDLPPLGHLERSRNVLSYALLLRDRHSHLSSAGESRGAGSGSGSLLRLLPTKPWLSRSELPGLRPRCCDPRRETQCKPGTFHPSL